MDAIFNIYNTLSSTYWYPVDFNSVTNDYNFTKFPISFDNGINFYLHNFLENAEDFSFNRKTGLVLTNPTNNNFFIKNNVLPDNSNQLIDIESPIYATQNIQDITNNGYNLKIVGSITFGNGIINKGTVFDGGLSYIIPTQGILKFGTNDFSVSCWVRPTEAPNENQNIFAWGIWPNTSGFNIFYNSSSIQVFLGGFNEIISSNTSPLNKWNHIVLTRTNGTAKLYVNGVLIGTADWNYNFTDGLQYVGRAQDVNNYKLNGTLDEVGVWRRSLSQSEVSSLFNSGSGISYGSVNFPPAAEAYWDLNSTKNLIIRSVPSSTALNAPKLLHASNSTNFSSEDTIKFTFYSDDVVTIKNSDKKVLTWYGVGEGNLLFADEISPPSNAQKFNYFLNPSSIVLFQYGSNYSNIVIENLDTNNLIISPTPLTQNSIPSNSIINFVSYTEYAPTLDNSVQDSFIVKYEASPIYSQSQLKVNNNSNSTNKFVQNYLAAFPVENPNINEKDSSYLLQFHGLKNYQTPEYTYSTSNPLLSSAVSVRRIYNKIYSGTNQNKGYNNVYLGYQANTKQYVFPLGKETYFYFPSTNVRYPISAVGLIEDGATAGEIPFVSDRLSVYRQNYEEITPGVPQPPSITKQDNTWLCAWLSGSNLGSKIWMDRYYNAAYYSLDQALTAQAIVYNDKINASKPYTYDVPSSIVLEPGILYKYYRADKENSKSFVQYLNYDPINPLGSKVLDITDWSSDQLTDNSNYKNDGVVVYNTNPQNFQKSYFNLDGTNSVVFPSRTSLLQNEKLTVSVWVYVDNWSKIYGEQIFGNYYSSGFGLINESFTSAPLFTIVNTATLSAYNLNYNLLNLSQKSLPKISSYSQYNIIQRLPDLSYWIFDASTKTGKKYNPSNKLISSVPTLSSYISYIDQVEIDSDQNLYFYDNAIKVYVKTDSNGKFINSVDLSSYKGINRIEIDLNDNVQVIYGTSSVIDNNNNIWEVVGGNLYKNRMVFANVGVTQQITCDSQNRIWISHLQDTISALDTTNNLFIFSERLGKTSTLPIDPCLNQEIFRTIDFLKVPFSETCNNNLTYNDQLVVVDNRDNEVYMLNSSGELISKLDLRGLVSDGDVLNFKAKGDFTSYQYMRKYGGLLQNNLTWKLKIADPFGNNSQLISLPYDVSNLPPGWHHFTLTFDALQGLATYYIDSVKVNQKTFTPAAYTLYYDYRSSLVLGAASVLNTTLNDIIGIENSYKFIGKISDLKMYSKYLTQGEIEQMYFSSDFAVPRENLVWNMKVGDRNYIEEIEHWFKFQMPGSKSKYFNINIHNLNIDNMDIKNIIEDAIRENVSKIAPSETSLYNINWM